MGQDIEWGGVLPMQQNIWWGSWFKDLIVSVKFMGTGPAYIAAVGPNK